jgi:hypothetical protein
MVHTWKAKYQILPAYIWFLKVEIPGLKLLGKSMDMYGLIRKF